MSLPLFDLISPDGSIQALERQHETLVAKVLVEGISPNFIGHQIPVTEIEFDLKSSLAQLGIESKCLSLNLYDRKAELTIELIPFGELAKEMLDLLEPGAFVGKLFAKDKRRLVRDPFYLERMFERFDPEGRPLLHFGSGEKIPMEKVEGRTIAHVPLLPGAVTYEPSINGFLPTLAKALHRPDLSMRPLLALHQRRDEKALRAPLANEILLVKTAPLHIRTVFARVAHDKLPQGLSHTNAALLDPTTTASGDIYELYGSSGTIETIPLEFYTLEPTQEWVFFSDRDQLKNSLKNPDILFDTFAKGPDPKDKASAFVCKGDQLANLKAKDWVVRSGEKASFPGFLRPSEQVRLIEQYIESEPAYPFLKAIAEERITSEGILLCRYLPSPLMKRMLLSASAIRAVKRIYFERPSRDQNDFFTHEDRAMLLDLAKFGIPVFWVDRKTERILRYVPRIQSESGMFVPIEHVETFLKATLFGVYGSNLLEGGFEKELKTFLKGILALKEKSVHPLLQAPLALVTGGGPGAMEVGNKIAKELGLLSCANIVDFGKKGPVNEQRENPYVEAKMTYSLDHLVERQAEFNLDFPLFLPGGIGTDFEYALEEVRRKVGSHSSSPVLLFGGKEYWGSKITPRFQANLKSGTIAGSEWTSNCFYAIENAEEGLQILKRYFEGNLAIGKEGPIYQTGFGTID